MVSTLDFALATTGARDDDWLRHELHFVWENFFRDIPRVNQVEISFARAWKSRLGLIRLTESGCQTYIGINCLLRDDEVPSQVLSVTIAHELVHYSHGFGSPLPRKHRHPHNGDIVTQDLVSRGLASELQVFKDWTSKHWYSFYYACVPQRRYEQSKNGHRVR